MHPRTKYAKSGGVHIAYQVIGDGPFDLVFVPGAVSHVEFWWEDPAMASFLGRLAAFSRLILFDKRGTGLSDRVADSDLPTLEQRMDDVRAVMDAAGSPRAALFGWSEGGPMCALFSATYPERTLALVMYGSFARWFRNSEHPWGLPPEALDAMIEIADQHWGEGRALDFTAPSLAGDEHMRQSWGRLFADLKGSMEMLADRDPEEARTLPDPVLELMMEAVHRYEGTVNQVMGDGIMALFDAPVAHEDHAQRAIARHGDDRVVTDRGAFVGHVLGELALEMIARDLDHKAAISASRGTGGVEAKGSVTSRRTMSAMCPDTHPQGRFVPHAPCAIHSPGVRAA
jgi:pimeloyl-ACP methyl ester carboxylesterase